MIILRAQVYEVMQDFCPASVVRPEFFLEALSMSNIPYPRTRNSQP